MFLSPWILLPPPPGGRGAVIIIAVVAGACGSVNINTIKEVYAGMQPSRMNISIGNVYDDGCSGPSTHNTGAGSGPEFCPSGLLPAVQYYVVLYYYTARAVCGSMF